MAKPPGDRLSFDKQHHARLKTDGSDRRAGPSGASGAPDTPHASGPHHLDDHDCADAARRLLAQRRSILHDLDDVLRGLVHRFVHGHGRTWLRLVIGALVLSLAGMGAMGLLWWRLGEGPINVDVVTPWIASAVEGNFGENYQVTIAGTQIERDRSGRTSVRVRDVLVRDPQGRQVASAPKAEVGISVLGLLTGDVRAESLNLVGAELAVRIEQDGRVAIFAGSESAPAEAAAPLSSTPPKPRAATAADGAADPLAAPDNAEAKGKGMAGMLSLLAWIDSLGATGLDGHDLNELGLKNGRLVVDDRQSGRQLTFDNITLALQRQSGGVALSVGAENGNRPWLLRAAVGPPSNGVRRVEILADKVSIEDILLALRMNDGTYSANMPVTGRLRGEIGRDGLPTYFAGKLVAGEGEVIDRTVPEFPMKIDHAEVTVEWDANRHVMVAPFQVVSGNNRVTLRSHLEAPNGQTPYWRLGLGGGTILLAGAEGENPVILNRVAVGIVFDSDTRRVVLQRADFSNGEIGVAGSGSYDYSTDEPRLSLGIAGTPMSMSALKRIWPATVAPEVREWVQGHVGDGAVRRVDIAINAPMKTLARNGPPIPDEGLSVDMAATGVGLRPVDSLPPIMGADMRVRVTGRTAKIEIGGAELETPKGRKLALSDVAFNVTNMSLKPIPANVAFRVKGSAPAAAELLAMDRLSDFSGAPVDPETSRGDLDAQVNLTLPLKRDLARGETLYALDVNLSNFSADRMVLGQKLEADKLKVLADNQGYQIRGDVRIAGIPASIDYRKPRAAQDAEIKLQAQLDSAAQARFGLDRSGGVTGTIPLKANGVIGEGGRPTKIAVEADLTGVTIDNPAPGWAKPRGIPGKMTLNVASKPGSIRAEDIVIDGGGADIKGSAEFSGDGDFVSASFPAYHTSPGDKASLRVERQRDGPLKVIMRGDIFDGRDFVKNALAGRANEGDEKSADLDIDVKLGAIAGHHGEALRGFDLKMSRRDGALKTFVMSAKIGRDASLVGDLRGQTGRGQVFYVESGDAGAFFRFTDTYSRMQGGQMWVAMDPPSADDRPKEGLLNVRDFSIRGEAALDRVVAGGPSSAQDGVPFSQMRVEFTRNGGTLNIREGVVRGPVVGATIAGSLDFAAKRVHMSGTFVPLYGLNNMFGQIPIVGLFLGGGSNEGLVGVTYEVVGSPGAPVLRVNPISAVAPGLLRKFFEFPNSRGFTGTTPEAAR